jgi:hypothetical protein
LLARDESAVEEIRFVLDLDRHAGRIGSPRTMRTSMA